MEFKTRAQKECYDKVSSMMKDLFGELAVRRDDRPAFVLTLGSTAGLVAVYPWGDDDAIICTKAYVVMGAELVPDLMQFLLRKNGDIHFGAFGIDDDGDIFFEHAIIGSTCDKEELKASVLAVLFTADRFDDEIVARWGGQRVLDRAR